MALTSCLKCSGVISTKASTCPHCGESVQAPSQSGEPSDSNSAHAVLGSGFGESFGMDDADDLGVAKAVSDTVTQFKSLDYGFLLPFKKIFSTSLLRKRAVRWVCFFGIAPIAIYLVTLNFKLPFIQTVWLLQLYFCFFWALYFHSLIRPSRAIWKRAVGYAVFTVIITIPLVVIENTVPFIRDILAGFDSEQFTPRFVACVFGVGPLEELCKAVPLLWFGLRKNKLHGIREGLFLGLMSGLGFAAIEGVGYTFGAAAINNGSEAAFTLQILQTIFRFMSGSLLHAAWAGTVGWFIGLASTRTGARWPIVAVGIAFAAILHGLNDVVAGGWLQLVSATVSILVFLAYLVHGEEEQSLQTGIPSPATES